MLGLLNLACRMNEKKKDLQAEKNIENVDHRGRKLEDWSHRRLAPCS
jgi:hypothetical protein